jgi:hypothetical protein
MSPEQLRKVFRDHIDRLLAFSKSLPWENRHFYSFWLCQTYQFTRHTPTFISLIASKYGGSDWDAQGATLKNLQGESGLDQLLINDLAELGFKCDRWPQLLETSTFYQTQYYWIHQFGPAAHTGYSFLLEGLAAFGAAEVAKRVQQSHGPTCASFLAIRAAVDPRHFEEGIDRLASSPKQLVDAAVTNLHQSSALYRKMLQVAKDVALTT